MANTVTVDGTAGGHTGTTGKITANREFYSCGVAGNGAMHQSDIGLFQLAIGEHLTELAMSAVVFGDDDDSAGLLVEAMHDSRAKISADVGEFVEVMQQGIDQSSTAAFVRSVLRGSSACPGVDHHSGRLVDHSQMNVLEKDVERMSSGNAWSGGG